MAGMGVVLALEGSAATLHASNFVSSYIWRSQDPRHGGFSGLELSPDGSRFTAISDRAGWTTGVIQRDGAGHIRAIQAAAVTPLRDTNAKPLAGWRADTEGLAIAPNGQAYVSFEGKASARVMQFKTLADAGKDLPSPPEFAMLRNNAALEALAIDDQGTLYTLPESPKGAGPLPVFRYKAGRWDQPGILSRNTGFDPVGADFGPDGRFYLLERGFHGIFGFSSRVRSFAVIGGAFSDEQLELQTAPATHDNLEGLSVWRGPTGDVWMTMIADDNFFWMQRTEVVEYRVLAK